MGIEFEGKKMSCCFNLERDFTDAMAAYSEDSDYHSCVAWGQQSRDRLYLDTEDIDRWRTTKSESQSLRLYPTDKVKKPRRTYLLRFYAHHESAKETRSDSYVFVHHGNWRQYMKQYRKYHTVGQAGRVNYEDLEWKGLLRHINISETLRELLFNSSASLHPLPTFPSQDHWCRETSLHTSVSPTCAVQAQAAAETTGSLRHPPKNTPKRNLFQSFNLASIKQRKYRPSWLRTSNECRKTKDRPNAFCESQRGRSYAGSKNEKLEIRHSGRIIKLLKDDGKEDCPTKSKEKVAGLSKKVKKDKNSRNGASELQVYRTPMAPESHDFISHIPGVGIPKTDVLKTSYVSRSRDSPETVLKGSRMSCRERVDDLQFTLFKAEGLGSLRLQNGGKREPNKGDHNNNKRTVERAIKQRVEQAGRAVKKPDFQRNLLMKSKPVKPSSSAQMLADDTRQNFAIINYGSLRKIEPIKASRNNEMNRDVFDDTRRFAEPLPIQTIICGNKYATAEEHEARLKATASSPMVVPT